METKSQRTDLQRLEAQIAGAEAQIDRHQQAIDGGDNPTLHHKEISRLRKELRDCIKTRHLMRQDLGDLIGRDEMRAVGQKLAVAAATRAKSVYSDVPDADGRFNDFVEGLIDDFSEAVGMPVSEHERESEQERLEKIADMRAEWAAQQNGTQVLLDLRLQRREKLAAELAELDSEIAKLRKHVAA